MFEQAILTEQKRPWTVAASFTMQSAFIGGAVLLSILSIERLPSLTVQAPLPPLPRPFTPVEIVNTMPGGAATTSPFPGAKKVFVPPRIPQYVSMTPDEGVTGVPPAVSALGGGGGLASGVLLGGPYPWSEAARVPPPPPPPPAKKAEVAAPKTITLGGSVIAAKLVRKITPEYPMAARIARVSGVVRLAALIGTDGTIRRLDVIEGHPLLTKAAIDAVKQWLYIPTLLNGEPVEVKAPIEVRFMLSNQ